MSFLAIQLEDAESLDEVRRWMNSKFVHDKLRTITAFQIIPKKSRFDEYGLDTYDCIVVGEINYDNSQHKVFKNTYTVGEITHNG